MYNPPNIIKNPQMPVVLVAGGAGFPGSHLCESLPSKNLRGAAIDNLQSGKKDYLTGLLSHPRFAFLEQNLNAGLPEKVESVDAIIHLAGEEIHLAEAENLSLNSLVSNSLTTYHLLELAKACRAKLVLTSSLGLYQGIVSGTSLNNYFGEGSEDERVFSYNEAKRYAESLAWEYFKRDDLDVRVARLPEIYGPRMDFDSSSNLGRFLKSLIEKRDLTILGDGLDKDFYLYVTDAVEGLYSCLTKKKTAGKIFTLCENKPITQLEQAYLLKEFSAPGTSITFKPGQTKKHTTDPKSINTKNLKEISFKPKVGLREGLKRTLESFNYDPKLSLGRVERREKATSPVKIPEGFFNQKIGRIVGVRRLRKPPLKEMGIYISLALTLFFSPFLIVPFLGLGYNLGKGYLIYKNLTTSLKNLDIIKIESELDGLSQALNAAQANLNNFPAPSSAKRPYLKVLGAGTKVSRAGSQIIKALIPDIAYLHNLSAKAANINNYPYLEAENSNTLINGAVDLLSLAEADLKDSSFEKSPAVLKDLSQKSLGEINKAKRMAAMAKASVLLTPELLGFDNLRRYLLLLQNSNELRATGGFIGSLIKIEVTGGILSEPKVEDIYNLDGLIDEKGIKLKAPKAYKDNLGTENLYLRDANFYISFPQSAEKIKSLYESVSGEKIDGVLAIDLMFVRDLLSAIGPIQIATYNESVDGNNIFEKVQFHSEASFSPGTSSKKTFLSLLSQKLLEQLLNPSQEKYLPLIKAVLKSFEEKHLLTELYLPHAFLLSQLDFRGEVKDFDGDYLMVIDANVGANKANYFVKRSINYETERGNREGEFNSILSISYEHKGESNAWPGGPYKNYLRLLLPRKASFLRAEKITDKEEDVTTKVEVDEEAGKTSLALTFELPVSSKAIYNFFYILPPNIFSAKGSTYRLLVQKQPGTEGDPFRAKFVLPFGQDLETDLSQGFTRQGTSVIFEGNLRKDLELKIPLSSK